MPGTKLKNRLDRLERAFYVPPPRQPIDVNALIGKLLVAFGYPGCPVVRQAHESVVEAFCRTVHIDPRELKAMLRERLGTTPHLRSFDDPPVSKCHRGSRFRTGAGVY